MKTETEYLRAELIAAKTLLARCVGHIEAEAACMKIMHGAKPTAAQKALLADIAGFQPRGVHVLPEGVRANV